MADEATTTAVAEGEPAISTGEHSAEEIAQMDAINDKFFSNFPKQTNPDVTPAAGAEPTEKKAAPIPEKKAEPAAAAEADDLTLPAEIAPAADKPEGDKTIEQQIEEKYGTVPEKPSRGFKSKEEEANWGRTRDSHEKLKLDLVEAQKRLSAPSQPDEKLKAQYEETIKRNEQLNSIVEQLAAERLPYVQQTFNEPKEREIKLAKKTLEAAGIEPGEIDTLLSLPESEREKAENQILDNVESANAKRKLSKSLETIYDLDERRAEFLKDRKTNVEKLTEAQKAEQFRMQAQQEKNIIQSVDDIAAHLVKNGFEFAAKSGKPGHEKWDARIDSRIEQAKNVVLKNKDPMVVIESVVRGQFADDYRRALHNTISRAEKSEAKLKEYEGALPDLSERGVDRNGAKNGEPYDNFDPADDPLTASRKITAQMLREGRH